MTRLTSKIKIILITLVATLFTSAVANGQQETNDPLVTDQQYLFDVHRLDEAWSYTTGNTNTQIAIHSQLGFIQNHEDLSSGRLLNPRGALLRPMMDYASELAGIIGADTDNAVGMAGIDRHARLRSYSALRHSQSDDPFDQVITAELPDGSTEQYFLDLAEYAQLVNQARIDNMDIHLFTFGMPTGREVEYEVDVPDASDLFDVSFTDSVSFPSARQNFFEELGNRGTNILNTLCGGIFGSCTSPPNPLESFRTALGNLVRLGNQVVIAPAGDLQEPGQQTMEYQPASFDRFVTAVGGITEDSDDLLVPWDRTRPAPYVDVAAYAEDVVGLSGEASDAYNTSFGGTTAAAAIATGVAAVLRGEESSLSSEDIGEILKRTAIGVGSGVRSDETGFGAIDAAAALAFVTNKDMVRENQQVSEVLTTQDTDSVRYLSGEEFHHYNPCGGGASGCPVIKANLHEFTARVEYSSTFTTPPDVWVRWAESDGVDLSYRIVGDRVRSYYDPFKKDLEVISVDETGFTVHGHYWYASFYDVLGRKHPNSAYIPSTPDNFDIAYTAFGAEGPAPRRLLKSISLALRTSTVASKGPGQPM